MVIVIMAGGGGSRLWPLSRQNKPKQFLDLGTGKTLLEHTYERARTLAEPQNIFVATTKDYADQVRQLLPQVPVEQIFFEPERRDTGPAFAAAAVQLKLKGKADDPTTFMWSDHVFTNETEFLDDLQKIPTLIEGNPNAVVIVGHTPTFPETGFGYIEVGEKVAGFDDVFHVKAFKEKPDKATAEGYLAAGNFFWNMAYISLKPSFLLSELEQYQPELMQTIGEYEKAIEQGDADAADKAYAAAPKVAIDYALLEKTPDIIAVTGDYGWNDVGNWGAVKDVFGISGDHIAKGHHFHVDSDNNYIYNATDRAVSLIGVKDTIVVVTDDAILVTDKDSSHKVKDIVQQLEKDGLGHLL